MGDRVRSVRGLSQRGCYFPQSPETGGDLEENGLVLGDEEDFRTVGHSSIPPSVCVKSAPIVFLVFAMADPDLKPLYERGRLMPVLHDRPKEAARIGRIIAAFGELEFILGLCLAEALGDQDTALRTIFLLRNDVSRIAVAESLLRPICAKIGIKDRLAATIVAVEACHAIRNQYAHCHYAQIKRQGLFLTNLQEAADKQELFEYFWRHVDVKLLNQQEKYFLYAIQCLQFVEHELRFKLGTTGVPHSSPWPPELKPPQKHNAPTAHIPRWLSEAQKRRHGELALEYEYSAGLRQRLPKPRKAPRLSSRQRREVALKRVGKTSRARP